MPDPDGRRKRYNHIIRGESGDIDRFHCKACPRRRKPIHDLCSAQASDPALFGALAAG